jgi:hypothetical protein
MKGEQAEEQGKAGETRENSLLTRLISGEVYVTSAL